MPRPPEKALPERIVHAIMRAREEGIPTPYYLYDEAGIRETARGFQATMSQIGKTREGFRNFFAVKALPNPSILRILQEEGMGMDCSSLAELTMVKHLGIDGKDVMFTSNNTPDAEFRAALDLDSIINLDDITHVDRLAAVAGDRFPTTLSFRYNPGDLKKGNFIIGKPVDAKFGLRRDQLSQAYAQAHEKEVTRFGLHTMVASNELDPAYFCDTAEMLFRTARELEEERQMRFAFLNLGGGIGIPYRPGEQPVDIHRVATGISESLQRHFPDAKPDIFMECGRYITGPHGYLVTSVRQVAEKHKSFVGVDASMSNLMRPGMYGAYHHITALDENGVMTFDHDTARQFDVTGGLCENNDKFAIDRPLPEVRRGNTLVLHDTGAHGHAMGFQYNGFLRSAEYLLGTYGKVKCVRREETVYDLFATLNGLWPA